MDFLSLYFSYYTSTCYNPDRQNKPFLFISLSWQHPPRNILQLPWPTATR